MAFVEWLCERLMRRLARRNLKAHGDHMAVFSWDYIGLQVMIHGTYEGTFLDQTMAFLKAQGVDTGGIYLDIGANIGNHAIYFSRFGRKVLAFEPNPKVFRLLSLNSEGRRIEALNYGLSDRDGTFTFQVAPDNLGESHIVQDGGVPGNGSIAIEVRAFDGIEAFRTLEVDVVKIDVEFHEAEVIAGCREMFLRCRPAIIFEQMAGEVRDGTSETVELVRSLGYRIHYFGHAMDLPKGIRGIGSLVLGVFGDRPGFRPLRRMRRKTYNLVAIPEELHPA